MLGDTPCPHHLLLFPQHLPHLRTSTFRLTVVRCFRSFPLFSASFRFSLFSLLTYSLFVFSLFFYFIVLSFHCSFYHCHNFPLFSIFVYSSDRFLAEVLSFSFRIPC